MGIFKGICLTGSFLLLLKGGGVSVNINISKKIFNEAYLPYLEVYDKRFEVYYGG